MNIIEKPGGISYSTTASVNASTTNQCACNYGDRLTLKSNTKSVLVVPDGATTVYVRGNALCL